jgi:hypothetical protein
MSSSSIPTPWRVADVTFIESGSPTLQALKTAILNNGQLGVGGSILDFRPVEIQCDFSLLGKSGIVWFPLASGRLSKNPRKIWLFSFHVVVT